MNLLLQLPYRLFIQPYKGVAPITWWLFVGILSNSMVLSSTTWLTFYMYYLNQPIIMLTFITFALAIGAILGSCVLIIYPHINPFRLIFLSTLGNAACFLLLSLGVTIGAIILTLTFLISINLSLFRGSFVSVITDTAPASSNMQAVVGLRRIGINIGVGLGTLIVPFILPLGYSLIFIAFALFASITFIIFYTISLQQPLPKSPKLSTPSESLLGIQLSKPQHQLFVITLVIIGLIFMVIHHGRYLFAIYLNKYAIPNSEHVIAIYMNSSLILTLLFQVPISQWVSRVNFKQVQIASFLILVVGRIVLFSNLHSVGFIYTMGLITSLAEMMILPSLLDYILKNGIVSKNHSSGWYNLTFSLTQLSAVGYVYIFTHYSPMVYAFSVIILLVPFAYGLKQEHKIKLTYH